MQLSEKNQKSSNSKLKHLSCSLIMTICPLQL